MDNDNSAHRENNAPKRGRPFARGNSGRPKGTPNKVTMTLREAVLLAAEKAGGRGGLVGYLQARAIDHPAAFLSLLGKVLPMQVAGADGKPIEMVPRPSPEVISDFRAAVQRFMERAEERAPSLPSPGNETGSWPTS